MIEQKRSVFRGALNGDSVQDITGRVAESLDFFLRGMSEPKTEKNIGDSVIFFFCMSNGTNLDIKPVRINSKNIEYEDDVDFSSFPGSVEGRKKIRAWGFADVKIQTTIYRLGQHSYYTCDLAVVNLAPDNHDLGACS